MLLIQVLDRVKLLEEQLAYTALRASQMRSLLILISEGATDAESAALTLLRELYPEDYGIGLGISGNLKKLEEER